MSDGEQLSTHTRNSLTLRVGSVLIILKNGFWKKKNNQKNKVTLKATVTQKCH